MAVNVRTWGTTPNAWLWILALAVLAFFLLFVVGSFILQLALNYVFSLLYTWKVLGNPIVITLWQTFWLIVAAIIIRVILFGQHLNFVQGAMYRRPMQQPPKQKPS